MATGLSGQSRYKTAIPVVPTLKLDIKLWLLTKGWTNVLDQLYQNDGMKAGLIAAMTERIPDDDKY